MGEQQRLSSAALLRFQAQLVAQLRSYNAKLRIPDQSKSSLQLATSGDTSSANSVSENFECGDRESDDSVNNQQDVETVSKNCSLSSAALRRIQAQIVAHIRAYNVKLGLRTEAEAEQPACRFGAIAAAATETSSDTKNSCSNQFLESTSSNDAEYHDHVSKDCRGGDRAACCSTKRRNNLLYSADIPEQATFDFSKLKKKRFRPFPN